jgi:uncharacterized protein (TIGR02145 family)
MEKLNKIQKYIVILALGIIVLSGCKKSESITKVDPVITWSNPVDIVVGTKLSTMQLNASVDVVGDIVYTPAEGTKLDVVGNNQPLTVTFTPWDWEHFNNVSKTVYINVTTGVPTVPQGNSHCIFNPAVTYGTMTDQEGNQYKTVTIGTQTWMAENLRTITYRDGSNITKVTDIASWPNTPTGTYFSHFGYSLDSLRTWGLMYNWYAATDSRNIAPTGWHLPTDADWQQLSDYLGGDAVSGGKCMEQGLRNWSETISGIVNETGFTAIGGGMIWNDVSYAAPSYSFNRPREIGVYWSATSASDAENTANGGPSAHFTMLKYGYLPMYHTNDLANDGIYIRLVKD